MKNIVVFAGSNSKNSINKELAIYTSSLLENVEVVILDLNDFIVPLFGVDEESVNGIPKRASDFLKIIHNSDGIILSLAEHNGNFAAVFKNIYDWCSRITQKLWNNIPMFVMATSPGSRGGANVLAIAKSGFPYMGGNIIADFSLPNFYDNFKEGKIINLNLYTSLKAQVIQFENSVHQ